MILNTEINKREVDYNWVNKYLVYIYKNLIY